MSSITSCKIPSSRASKAILDKLEPPPPKRESIDDTLMRELEVSLDDSHASKPVAKAPASLDDEMTKLLGELASQKR